MITPEEIVGEKWAAWYRLTPQERWRESEKLWEFICILVARLSRNLILKVLFSTRKHRVHPLLIHQGCVFEGAAEFSRNNDLTILTFS